MINSNNVNRKSSKSISARFVIFCLCLNALSLCIASIKNAERTLIDINIRVSTSILVLRITLPPNLTSRPPSFMIRNAVVQHPWVEKTSGKVIGSTILNYWRGDISASLVNAVHEVLNQFTINPPKIIEVKKNSKSRNIDTSFPMPSIPDDFSELRSLNNDELKELDEDEEKLNKFFYELDIIKTPIQIRDDLISHSREQALENLKLENEINQLKYRYDQLKQQALEQYQILNQYKEQNAKTIGKYSELNISALVKHNISALEASSDKISKEFLNGNKVTEDFVSDYISHRENYHQAVAKLSVFSKTHQKASISK